jgi:hypothetical protein
MLLKKSAILMIVNAILGFKSKRALYQLSEVFFGFISMAVCDDVLSAKSPAKAVAVFGPARRLIFCNILLLI